MRAAWHREDTPALSTLNLGGNFPVFFAVQVGISRYFSRFKWESPGIFRGSSGNLPVFFAVQVGISRYFSRFKGESPGVFIVYFIIF